MEYIDIQEDELLSRQYFQLNLSKLGREVYELGCL